MVLTRSQVKKLEQEASDIRQQLFDFQGIDMQHFVGYYEGLIWQTMREVTRANEHCPSTLLPNHDFHSSLFSTANSALKQAQRSLLDLHCFMAYDVEDLTHQIAHIRKRMEMWRNIVKS